MTKTCGECKYFNGLAHGFCKNKQGRLSVQMNDLICQNYKPKPTNGDKIRQMSNEKLKKIIDCPYPDDLCVHRHDEYPCECCKRDWLNAPAESEGEDE